MAHHQFVPHAIVTSSSRRTSRVTAYSYGSCFASLTPGYPRSSALRHLRHEPVLRQEQCYELDEVGPRQFSSLPAVILLEHVLPDCFDDLAGGFACQDRKRVIETSGMNSVPICRRFQRENPTQNVSRESVRTERVNMVVDPVGMPNEHIEFFMATRIKVSANVPALLLKDGSRHLAKAARFPERVSPTAL